MKIVLKTDKDFDSAISKLNEKYGEDFEILNGFHESQLDFSSFINGFIDKNVADVTIDANANASNKDVRSLLSEKGKPHDKIFAFSKIFYEIKKKYGFKTAKEWIETEYNGGFYLHDAPSSSFMPYCYAYDLSRLATEGLFFLKRYNNQPPKHLTTFIDDVIEYISFMSNRSSGAVGIPNILIWTYYFWKKDCKSGHFIKDPDYYIRQTFQKFIYRLNQPFMRIDQTAFVNVSIFDRNYIESLFGGMKYPDGTYVIDEIEGLIEHQKVFMETVSKIRSENMFTFPILTYSLLYKDNKFVDEDFARWCSDHNTKWNDSNFFVSDDVTTLSNCPMSGDTPILYWNNYYDKYKVESIKNVYDDICRTLARYGMKETPVIKTISNGKAIKCKINKFNESAEYEIKLVNGASICTTGNHLNKTLRGDEIRTVDLTTNDYLPVSLTPYEETNDMTYEDGKLIGMFLGDGSYRNEKELTFSLNRHSEKDLIDFIYDYCPRKFGAKITEGFSFDPDNYVDIKVNSRYLEGLIEEYVIGSDTSNKVLSSKAISKSVDFRKGIIDGLYATHKKGSNRFYVSSEELKDSIVTLLASMGIATMVLEDKWGYEQDYKFWDDTKYIIQYYTLDSSIQNEDVCIIHDGFMWFRIEQINKIKGTDCSYCLEVIDENTEPIFMLPNGIHTHNCRLLSDTSKLNAFINSIGGTALSIGSVKVNTINLMRIALEANNDKEKYLKILKERAILCCKVLDVVRHIIKRNIEKGLLPNYQDGAVELDKQYCTIGILGLYEAVEKMGFIRRDDLGCIYYTDEGIEFASEIFEVLNDVKDNFTDDYSFNIESVPAERAAVILCQKDNLLYNLHDKFIYSNQWSPLSEKCTIKEKLKVSSILDKKCSGGSIAHINLEANFPNKDVAWDMLNKIAKSGVIYFAFNTRINECENHHGFVGTDICPTCGEGVYDSYQRIVGYLVPTRAYSKDRFREFTTRQWYDYASMQSE